MLQIVGQAQGIQKHNYEKEARSTIIKQNGTRALESEPSEWKIVLKPFLPLKKSLGSHISKLGEWGADLPQRVIGRIHTTCEETSVELVTTTVLHN